MNRINITLLTNGCYYDTEDSETYENVTEIELEGLVLSIQENNNYWFEVTPLNAGGDLDEKEYSSYVVEFENVIETYKKLKEICNEQKNNISEISITITLMNLMA